MQRILGLATLTLIAASTSAHAFQIETPVTFGCHEAITVDAARAAGFPDALRAPAPTEPQRRTMDDLTFTLRDRDVWTMAMLIGVRSNDLRDNQPIDVARLVHIHNDPDDQPAHCMRRPEHDGQDGDAGALATCTAYILGELDAGGLLADTLDLARTEPVPLYLAFRGRAIVELPSFAYRLGKALHALEDSYTHAFRNPQTDHVRHVTNWVDSIAGQAYDPPVDGYHHVGVLDDCRRDDPRERGRVARVTAAATRVVEAIADPMPGRRVRVEVALRAAFEQELGCTSSNRYCDAEELDEEPASGCAAGGPGSGALVAIAVLGLVRVRRRRDAPRGARPAAAGIAVIAIAMAATPARAEVPVQLDLRVGAALDHAAQATTVGVSTRLGRFSAGAVAEWNPWFSLDTGRGKLGAFNAYATLTRRWYESPAFSLYSRAELGSSTILFELVGVDRYRTGLYAGGSLLGIEIPLSACMALTLDPSHFAMPVPAITGFPFYYRQYRITAGLTWRVR